MRQPTQEQIKTPSRSGNRRAKPFENALVELRSGPSETDYAAAYARLLCECVIESKLEWDPALEEMYASTQTNPTKYRMTTSPVE
jgi:hypothetical protein